MAQRFLSTFALSHSAAPHEFLCETKPYHKICQTGIGGLHATIQGTRYRSTQRIRAGFDRANPDVSRSETANVATVITAICNWRRAGAQARDCEMMARRLIAAWHFPFSASLGALFHGVKGILRAASSGFRPFFVSACFIYIFLGHFGSASWRSGPASAHRHDDAKMIDLDVAQGDGRSESIGERFFIS
jgi:hypothetical protein